MRNSGKITDLLPTPVSPREENVGERFPQASPELGKINKDSKISPLAMGKNGEEILPMGKNGEEFYELLLYSPKINGVMQKDFSEKITSKS